MSRSGSYQTVYIILFDSELLINIDFESIDSSCFKPSSLVKMDSKSERNKANAPVDIFSIGEKMMLTK